MGTMKVLWSALGLIVIGALAVFLWLSAATPQESEILRDGVVIEGGRSPESSEPTPAGTVNMPKESPRKQPEQASEGAASRSEGGNDPAPAAPAVPAPPAQQQPVVPAQPAPEPRPAEPAQVPVPVQPTPEYAGDDDGDDDWGADGSDDGGDD